MAKKHNKIIIWIGYLLLVGLMIKFFQLLISRRQPDFKRLRHNFLHFIKEEQKEVEELTTGKESITEFCSDSGSILKNYFIPTNTNDYKPKILRTKPLFIMVAVALIIKIGLAAYLFSLYPSSATMSPIITNDLLVLINVDREVNGLLPLTLSQPLSQAAAAKAQDMISQDYFAHEGPNGLLPWDWISKEAYPYLYVGENLAMNFTTADGAHSALMLSPSHKNNILSDKYNDVGLAVLVGEWQGKETTMLVEIFGQEKIDKEIAIALKPENNLPVSEDQSVSDVIDVLSNTSIEESIPSQPPTTTEELPNTFIKDNNENILSWQETELIAGESSSLALSRDLPKEPILFKASAGNKDDWVFTTIRLTRYFFAGILAFLSLALLVNIFVRLTVQHKPVIIQSLLAILIIASLLWWHVHFLEKIASGVLIL